MQNALSQAEHMVLGQLITNEVQDVRILRAMADTPREPFVPEAWRAAAYGDEDIDMGGGRALMAPLTFAKLLQLVAIDENSRVLNVGTLSGYGAAVLARLAAQVAAIEIDTRLGEQANAHLARLGIDNVNLQQVKSLTDGYAASAPYDVIIIEGAIQFLPEKLGAQLAKGGRLAAVRNLAQRPGAHGGLSRGMLIRRIGNQLQTREYFDTGATLLPGFEYENSFRF